MFDEMRRAARRLNGVRVPISMPLDDEGSLDRLCPHEECGAEFKVIFEDWRDKVSDERAYCPLCRHEARSSQWNTPDQKRYIADVARNYAARTLNEAMAQDARGFNARQPQSGFITMSMSVKPGHLPILVPSRVGALMQQKFACEACGCRYASVGSSFFCPACGHNSAITAFADTITTVRRLIENLSLVAEALGDRDAAENATRQILESSVERLVGAFQRYMESLFGKLPGASTANPRRNAFQNLAESSDLWQAVNMARYEDLLPPREWQDLNRLFQQRHLIAHRAGVVDGQYRQKSGDLQYSVGQRIVISRASVGRLTDLVEKLGASKRAEVEQRLSVD